jgi:hypothetical protein
MHRKRFRLPGPQATPWPSSSHRLFCQAQLKKLESGQIITFVKLFKDPTYRYLLPMHCNMLSTATALVRTFTRVGGAQQVRTMAAQKGAFPYCGNPNGFKQIDASTIEVTPAPANVSVQRGSPCVPVQPAHAAHACKMRACVCVRPRGGGATLRVPPTSLSSGSLRLCRTRPANTTNHSRSGRL